MKAIPFMKWRWAAVALSAAALLAAIGSLSVRQLNWGLDFTGGTLVEVAYSDSADLGAIRTLLDQEGYEGAVVVSFGTDKDVLVRLPDGYSDEQGALMVDKLRAATDMSIELRRIEHRRAQVNVGAQPVAIRVDVTARVSGALVPWVWYVVPVYVVVERVAGPVGIHVGWGVRSVHRVPGGGVGAYIAVRGLVRV